MPSGQPAGSLGFAGREKCLGLVIVVGRDRDVVCSGAGIADNLDWACPPGFSGQEAASIEGIASRCREALIELDSRKEGQGGLAHPIRFKGMMLVGKNSFFLKNYF